MSGGGQYMPEPDWWLFVLGAIYGFLRAGMNLQAPLDDKINFIDEIQWNFAEAFGLCALAVYVFLDTYGFLHFVFMFFAPVGVAKVAHAIGIAVGLLNRERKTKSEQMMADSEERRDTTGQSEA